jgi:hypothetical protein
VRQELGFRDGLWPPVEKKRQELERLRGQRYYASMAEKLPPAQVERELCEKKPHGTLKSEFYENFVRTVVSSGPIFAQGGPYDPITNAAVGSVRQGALVRQGRSRTNCSVVVELQRLATDGRRESTVTAFARRVAILAVVFMACFGAAHARQGVAAPERPALTPAQMEAFLLKARIARMRDPGKGVTDTRRATLVDGTFEHDAQIQFVERERAVLEPAGAVDLTFKDLWRYNIAGYRLAVLLGMNNVPVSVERQVEGRRAAVTWWIDNVAMDERERVRQKASGPDPERTDRQIHVMRVFDELIQNIDRNQGNVLWTNDWKMWLIDHTRAFRLGEELLKPDLLTRCERGLLERMRGLTTTSVTRVLGDAMTTQEVSALLVRRDLIVRHFDDRIAKFGGAAVLFTLE